MNMLNLRLGPSPLRPAGGLAQENDVLPLLRQKFRVFKKRIEFGKPISATTAKSKNQRASSSKKIVLSRNSVRIYKEAAANSFSNQAMRSESSRML